MPHKNQQPALWTSVSSFAPPTDRPSGPGHCEAANAGGTSSGNVTSWARLFLGGLRADLPHLAPVYKLVTHCDGTVPVGLSRGRALRFPRTPTVGAQHRLPVRAARPGTAEPLWQRARFWPAPFPRDAAVLRAPAPAPPALASGAPPARSSRKSRSCCCRHSRGEARAARDLGPLLRTREAAAPGRGPAQREEGAARPGKGSALLGGVGVGLGGGEGQWGPQGAAGKGLEGPPVYSGTRSGEIKMSAAHRGAGQGVWGRIVWERDSGGPGVCDREGEGGM